MGLDTSASAVAILDLLRDAGYDAARGFDAEALIPQLLSGSERLRVPLAVHAAWLAGLPETRRTEIAEAWGAPQDDPSCDGTAFVFRVVRAGNIVIALQPDRGPRRAQGLLP